jgi:hypothetical protein
MDAGQSKITAPRVLLGPAFGSYLLVGIPCQGGERVSAVLHGSQSARAAFARPDNTTS